MKIKITVKDPDGVWDSLKDSKLDPNELPSEVENVVRKYIEFKEYITVELDTETGEARVCEV